MSQREIVDQRGGVIDDTATITLTIVCSPEQLAEVQARVRVLQADLLRLGATCWVSTHHAPPATVAEPSTPPIAPPAPVCWEDLADRADRCPRCLHWWVSHGVPGEDSCSCTTRADSVAEQPIVFCGCTFAEGNTVTPRQVRIWHDGTSWPLAPWQRVRLRALAPRPDRRRRLTAVPRLWLGAEHMTDKQKTKQLEARLAFATQENVLHEQLATLTSELAEARQRNPSEEQWEAVLPHFLDLCEAVALFRARWREIMRPDR